MAQEQPTALPALEVTTKSTAKKKKAAAAAPAPQATPVEQEPVSQEPAPLTVSAEPSIGTNTTDITSADLNRLNPTDVKGVFTGQPGILVGSSLPMSQKVYVNGIEENNLAVTIDGAAQNNKVFHHNGTNLIDPGLLKAVRVDAGVAPADAGFGALAGSIAYETKDVGDFLERDGFGGFAKTVFNTNGDVFTTNLAGYGMSKGFEVLGYFSFGDGGNFEAGNGETVEGTETNYLSGLAKLAYQAPSGDRFEISHERVNDDAPRPYRANAGYISVPRRPWEPRIRDYELNRQSTVFNYTDATPTNLWNPKVVVAYSKTDVTVPSFWGPNFSPVYTEQWITSGETDSFNGKAENKFTFNIGNLIAGFDFNRSRAKLIDPYDGSDEESFVGGVYAQARIEPVLGTRLSFGGRSDYQEFTGQDGIDRDDNGLSGNISGEQDLIGNFLTAKAGVSHVWAGVPLAENFIMNPAWNYFDGPESVEADNYTAGLVARYKGWTFEGTIFRTEIDNARVATYSNDVAGAIRTRDIESEGYELSARYDWTNGFLKVAYANIDVTIDGLPADTDTGNYVATPVGEIITITGAHTFAGTGLTVGGDVEIAPQYDEVSAGSPPFAAYQVFNAFAEYEPKWGGYDLTLRADVRNIFDETYSDRATYGTEFGNVTPLYEPGRSFLLSATSRF
jgi:hemoglobin/transferrin/lactoferrin receptor protein